MLVEYPITSPLSGSGELRKESMQTAEKNRFFN
jgi:hypothetical protein